MGYVKLGAVLGDQTVCAGAPGQEGRQVQGGNSGPQVQRQCSFHCILPKTWDALKVQTVLLLMVMIIVILKKIGL